MIRLSQESSLALRKKLPSVFTSVSFDKKAEIWGIIPEKDESRILPNRNSLYSSMFTLGSFFFLLYYLNYNQMSLENKGNIQYYWLNSSIIIY